MIQRKQSLFLLCAATCFVLTAFIPFGISAVNDVVGKAKQVTYTANASAIIAVCTSAGLLLCLGAIALFKKRNIQKNLCIVAAVTSLALAALHYLHFQKTLQSSLSFGILLSPLAGLLCMLAYRGVAADMKLIKSLDRLRD